MDEPERATLKVPYGLAADGRLVRPDDVGDDATSVVCPGCGVGLILRGGEGTKVRRHFAHEAETSCAPESVLHRAAKLAVARVLREAISGDGPPIEVHRPCSRCTALWPSPWRPSADAVELEHRLDSGRIADVAVLRDGKALAIVEIHVANRVSDEKAADIGGLRCAELEAQEVLDTPLTWFRRGERAQPRLCPRCAEVDRLLAEARIPPWTRELDAGDDDLFEAKLVLREREVRFVTRHDGETWKDVPVALLAREPAAGEWRRHRGARTRHAAAEAARWPGLPAYLRLYWEAETALAEFGGEWTGGTPEVPREERPAEDRWVAIRRIAAKRGQPVPAGRESPYWVEPYRCFSDDCGAEMLVYSWKGTPG